MLRKSAKRKNNKQRKISRQQLGEFLSRNDFRYAGRDTINGEIKGLDAYASVLKYIGKRSK